MSYKLRQTTMENAKIRFRYLPGRIRKCSPIMVEVDYPNLGLGVPAHRVLKVKVHQGEDLLKLLIEKLAEHEIKLEIG